MNGSAFTLHHEKALHHERLYIMKGSMSCKGSTLRNRKALHHEKSPQKKLRKKKEKNLVPYLRLFTEHITATLKLKRKRSPSKIASELRSYFC